MLPTSGGAGLALVELLEPLSAKSVLIVGVGGGVGSFAFAADAGARVIANARLRESSELLERLADALVAGRIVAPPITRISLEGVPAALSQASAGTLMARPSSRCEPWAGTPTGGGGRW